MLLRKMLRDMKLNRIQFISIFLMAILGVFVYAGINAEWYGMQTESERYYEETNLPDYWVIGKNFTSENVLAAGRIPGVKAIQRRMTVDGTAGLDGNPVIRLNIVDENTLSTPLVVEGSEFDVKMDGIWLDDSFAKAHGLGVGAEITIEVSGMGIKKTILGLILHPEYVYNVKDDSELMPDSGTFGFAFLPRSEVLNAARLPYNQLMISIDEGADGAAVKAGLEEALSGSYGMIISREGQISAAMFNNEIEQNKVMGEVFPIVFFLIATLTMLTTMTRMTSGQRMQIGTLKALGFSRRKILFHYVSYGLWIGLAGGMIGLLAGPMIIPPILFSMQKTLYTLPDWYAVLSPYDVIAVVIAVLCCGLSSYFACCKVLGEVPAATLRPRIPKAGRHTRIEKSRIWHKLGFTVQWNLRDIMRNKVRSAMAVVGVVGSAALLLWGMGLRDSVSFVTGWMYGDLYTYESKINLKEGITEEELESLVKEYPGQIIQESNVELKYGEAEKSGFLSVVGTGSEYNFEDRDRNSIRLPDEGIALSYKMAKLLNADIGDQIKWRIYGESPWRESTVSAIYRIPLEQGIAISQSAYEKMGYAVRPTALLCSCSTAGAEQLPGIKGIQDKKQMIDSFDSILDSMQMIIAILILAAVILGIVVLYNLGALSFTERTRELATLKVLGFSKEKIQSLLRKQNIWLTVLGILIGIPIGYLFIDYMLATMSDSSDFVSYVSPGSLVVCILVTFLLSVVVNLLMSGKVKSIDMVTSLKSVE